MLIVDIEGYRPFLERVVVVLKVKGGSIVVFEDDTRQESMYTPLVSLRRLGNGKV